MSGPKHEHAHAEEDVEYPDEAKILSSTKSVIEVLQLTREKTKHRRKHRSLAVNNLEEELTVSDAGSNTGTVVAMKMLVAARTRTN
jgi:hypothetical protein